MTLPGPIPLGAALALARQRLDALDARLLVEHVAACRHIDLIARPERPVAPEAAARLHALIERRAAGEPLAYLLGSQSFRGREFIVTPEVLIPRPETEVLIDEALKRARAWETPRIADLGTGSGIIAISLKLECPAARITATDFSPQALAVAAGNAARLGAVLRFEGGDWFSPLAGECFDLVLANPPYIAPDDPHLEKDGLPFEPRQALVGGQDGLAALKTLVAAAPPHLTTGGWLLLEHGYDQGEASRQMLRAAGFEAVFTQTDPAGQERVSGGRKTKG